MGFPSDSLVKNPPTKAGDAGSIPASEKIPWRRKGQPPPVFLPGKSHGQKSLVGSSPWGQRESDTAEHTHTGFPPVRNGLLGKTKQGSRPSSLVRVSPLQVQGRGLTNYRMLVPREQSKPIWTQSLKCAVLWPSYSFYEKWLGNVHLEPQ